MKPLGGGNRGREKGRTLSGRKQKKLVYLSKEKKLVMANFWNVPKILLKNSNVSADEKLILSVALQYFNAGFPEKLTIQQLCTVIGINEAMADTYIAELLSKGLLKQNSEFIELNHIELIKNKLFDPSNYKEFDKALS